MLEQLSISCNEAKITTKSEDEQNKGNEVAKLNNTFLKSHKGEIMKADLKLIHSLAKAKRSPTTK